MKNRKIKLIDIAKECKLSHSTISCYLSGKTPPPIWVVKICDEQFKIPPKAWYDIQTYILNNSERFGAIKILREKYNGTTKV